NHTADFQQFHIHWGHFTAAAPTTITFEAPDAAWLNLNVTHWYHVRVLWDFTPNQILSVSIRDITAGGATDTTDVSGLGWYLYGGPNDAPNPLPTDIRLFAGGIGDVSGWDNLSVGPPATGACCFVDGTCTVIGRSSCTSNGGLYGGDNT